MTGQRDPRPIMLAHHEIAPVKRGSIERPGLFRAGARADTRVTRPRCVLALVLASAAPARAQNPESDLLVAEAILAYEEQRYDAAQSALLQALRLAPDNL